MKKILYIGLLYCCMLLVVGSCTESDSEPAPTCIQAEVIGPDCDSGWYILKLENEAPDGSGKYVGQLQSGYVTTDNLPDAYKQPGRKLSVAVDIIGNYGPRCVTVTVMYPAVSVKRICASASATANEKE